ncbi:MAG: hypothetical protein IJT72_03865 [Lachnospiraceae bacterium]|nr:hypothetical protein [Lachnospiraceae bacterium]
MNLSGATGYLSDNDHDEIINSKESQKPHFLKVFISTIIIIILLEFIGNFLTYHLLSLMYSGKAIVYNTPRLFIIISFFIMGIFADISDMHYIPIITFSGVLIGILNPVLMQEESSIYANSCIYYIVAGIINSFFILMMFKLARGKRFAPLIAVSGRIIDAVFSFIFISSVMSSLPLYYIIGIELTAIIIIMLLFTFSGQFNFGHIRQGSSWHISPDDFAIRYKFTEKETEVFISALSFDGTMSELAKSLFMSRSVLYRNLSNICDKTGCGSFQAVKHLYYELPAVEKVQSASENSSEVVINKTNVKQSDTPDVSISNTPNIEAKSPDENTNQNHSKSSNTYKEKKSSSVKSEAYNNEPAPSTPDTDSVDRISVFAKKFSLSAKETQTLTAFLDNPEKTQKELADMQGTTLRTIQRHLAGIKTKTNVKSLIELSNLFHSL